MFVKLMIERYTHDLHTKTEVVLHDVTKCCGMNTSVSLKNVLFVKHWKKKQPRTLFLKIEYS
jgi:hypothetical protein